MSTGKRFSLSLLISTVLFTGFSFVAFSGLFPWLEVQFYSPRIVSEFQGNLGEAQRLTKDWEASQVQRIKLLLADSSFEGVFSPTFDRKRYEMARLFLLGSRWGGSVRIVDEKGEKLHFSTVDRDFASKTETRAVYRTYIELLADPSYQEELPLLANAGLDKAGVKLFVSPNGRVFQFVVPYVDAKSALNGWVVVNLPVEDLRLALLEKGARLAQQSLQFVTAESGFFGQQTRPDQALFDRVKSQVKSGILPPVQKLGVAGHETLTLVSQGGFSLLIADSSLTLSDTLKGIVLLGFYTVVFLTTFLLFNLRGDPVSVAAANIKRLQIKVVQQYLEEKNQDKVTSLREELERNSQAIKADIRKNLGRVRKKDGAWVDSYIEKSWQEILHLLDVRPQIAAGVAEGPPEAAPPAPPGEPTITLSEFRKILQEALAQLPQAPRGPFGVSAPPVRQPVAVAVPTGAEADLEELEDVEDLDDAEEVEDLDEVEEVSEAEDLEVLGEADDAEEVEEVEDAEEVEDLEEAEEALELPGDVEPEAVGSGEPVEDLDVLEEADDPIVEELESLEEAESEADDAELLEELSPAASGDAVPSFRGPEVDGPLAMLQASEEEFTDGELEELDELEELEHEGSGPSYSNQVLTLDELDSAWTEAAPGVFSEKDDVVTISDEVFANAEAPRDELGDLLREVAPDSGLAGFTPLEDFDVPMVITRDWRWTGGGFDWDRFAGDDGEVALFRALSDAVTAFDAFTAAILVREKTGWTAQNSVGFSDSGKVGLEFADVSALGETFLSDRKLHRIDGGGANPALRGSFHLKDLRFLRTVLLVPLLYQKEPAWLLLGLRNEPRDLLTLLAPRRIV